MTSSLAQGDLDDLRAEGLMPTDADIIRLHALGARITDGGETTCANIPRFAVVGGVVLHEPTIASQFWYDYAKKFADDSATEGFMFAFACAHGREPGYLDALRSPAEIESALGGFIGALTCTKDELERAVVYVVSGMDRERPEKTALEKETSKAETDEEREKRAYANIRSAIDEAIIGTGLTYAEIMERTRSQLYALLYDLHIKAGEKLTRTSARAHAQYLATLDAIASRLRAERDAKNPPRESSPRSGGGAS